MADQEKEELELRLIRAHHKSERQKSVITTFWVFLILAVIALLEYSCGTGGVGYGYGSANDPNGGGW